MNKWQVKILRKRIKSYKTYIVRTITISRTEVDEHIVKAKDILDALNRYLKWYERKYKCKQPDISINGWISETTSKYGKIVVIDDKGFKRYYF